MSLTTQSASVPVVEATRLAMGSPEMLQGRLEDVGGVGEDVWPAGELALIVDQPAHPGEVGRVADGLAGPRAEGHGLGGIGDELVEGRVGSGGRGFGEGESGAAFEVERRWFGGAACLAAAGPGFQTLPAIGSCNECGYRCGVTGRCVVFQVVGEEGREDLLAEVEAGVASGT